MSNETKQFFDKYAETWDNSCKCDQKKIAAIVTLAGITSGSRIIDIACGTGVMFSEMLSRNPAMILGVDLSDKMIAKAHDKFADSRLHLLASDLFDVHETEFDTAMIFSAYPHFPDKTRLANHISEMLKEDGRFIVAHCEGRDAINHCHSGKMVSQISWPLRSAKEEAAEFSDFFNIDMIVDTSEIYFFSGTKKTITE